MAAAWEDMTDIQRASALELMGGKRQANVLSALIQNFDTVEKVIETSANSAGSALEENERYLDSIQGKIDQFNNAMQAMWSNLLDSDVVKAFVEWGTKVIKSLDTVQGKFLAIVKVLAIFMAYKKINPFDFIKDIVGLVQTIKTTEGGVIQFVKSLFGIAPAMKVVTAETMANTVATQMNDAAKAKQMMSEMGLSKVTGTLSAAQKEQAATAILNAMSTGQLTMAQGNAMLAMLGYSGATMAADGSLKVLDTTTKSFMASNPIGWILLIVSAVMALVMWVSQLPSTMEKLTEELNDLKAELRDIQSELKSVNSELETTQDRMSELLAKDKLSFTEKEELNNLRKLNDELQRKVDLLDLEKKQKAREASQTFNKIMSEDLYGNWTEDWGANKGEEKIEYVTVFDADGQEKYTGKKNSWGAFWNELWYETILGDGLGTQRKFLTETEYLDKQMSDYSNASDDKKKEIEKVINGKFDEWEKVAGDLDYGVDEETDEWLDFIYNYQDKWAIASGGENAKTNAVSRIFNKDENTALKESIDGYVKELEKGDLSAKGRIASIISNNAELVADIEDSGMKIDDAVEYFTSLASDANYATIEGKIKEVDEAAKRLNASIGDLKTSNLDSIKQALTDKGWVDTEGNLMSDVIAEYFGGEDGGISEKTRVEIERLVQQIYDGKISVEDALKSFELFGVKSVLDIQIEEVKTNFKDVFVDLEDADGLINTFKELGDAIGSTVGALEAFNQAQADVADKGFVSIQTALQLMEYTDDYGSVLQVVDGKLQLAENAEQNLIQARLKAIQVSAHTAVADAQAAYDKAELAVQSYRSAMVEETSASTVATAWQKIVATAAGIKNALDNIWSGESIGDLYNSGYESYLTSATGYEMKYDDTKLQALEDALADSKKKLDETKDNAEIADYMVENPDGLEDVFESSDSKTKEEAEKDLIDDGWEKLLAKYENQLALITNERDLIQAEIDRMEAQGGKASTQYYDDLIRSSAEEKALLEQKKAAMEEYLAANADNIDQDTWTEYNNEINETAVAIKECEVNTIEWAEAIREIDLHYFEQITDEVSRLGEELDFVNSLLEDEEVSDENGNWSSAALTRMGLYTQQMEKAATEAAMYQDEIDKVNDQYEAGALSEEQYQEKLSDLVSGQQDAIQSYEDAKDSIVEMNEARIDAIKEGIEKEIEAYEDLIDAKKEELDAERELHDFRENIKNQTKDIASLERRIAALSGSSAASDVAERRKLEEQLQQAKEGLNDTYYDHSRDAQSAALDAEAEAYTQSKERYIEQLEEQLENTELLIQNSIMDVMLNADTVYTELNELADLYGIDLSDSLTLPWKNASAQAIQWKNELQTSMTSGEYAALIGEGGAITAFANGVATKLKGSWTSAQTAAKNYAGYLTGEELKNRFANTLTGFGSQIQTIIDKWNGVRKAADDAYAAQTRKVTVGGTGSGNTGNGNDNYTPTPTNYTPKPTPTPTPKPTVKLRGLMKTSREIILGPKSFVDENTETINGTKYYRDSKTGYYYKISDLNSKRRYDGGRTTGWAIPKGTWFYTKHAKGTTGTTRDEWAITDEPQFGDELTMYATPEGTLSFMRAGSTVIPADLTRELIDLPKVVDGLINRPKFDSGINMIANAINKPEIVVDMENFLKVDRVDKDTLPQLEAMMDKKIDTFAKQLNYSIKKFAR